MRYETCKNKAQNELEAQRAHEAGKELFGNGEYSRALKHFQAAHGKSKLINEKCIYEKSMREAQVEIKAKQMYEKGEKLYVAWNYSEAMNKYKDAMNASKVNKEHYRSCIEKAQAELDAAAFNEEGNALFAAAEFVKAKEKYEKAWHTSNIAKMGDNFIMRLLTAPHEYRRNVCRAQVEVDAIALSDKAKKLLKQGKLAEAASSIKEAFEKSEVESQREQYKKSGELIQARIHHEVGCQLTIEGDGEREVDLKIMKYKHAVLKFEMALSVCAQSEDSRRRMCVALSAIGDVAFSEGKYGEALENYTLAREKSKEKGTLLQDNILKAQTELEAMIACQRGEELSNEGRYSEALVQYETAHSKSRVSKMKDKYCSRLSEAKSEVEAMRLKSLGDELFARWQYEAALEKYEAAFKISPISKEKSLHAMNKEKAETIINILSAVGDLWKAGWDIENDVEENDRSEEAKETFGRVLCKVREGLRICPEDPSLKQYERLVLLKGEGNELFNKGLEYQMRGLELLSDAKELREKQNFELANEKFESAKDKFSKAIEKFRLGSETDKRFTDCVEFVLEQINDVDHSIKVIKQEVLNLKFIDLTMNFSERRTREEDNSELSEKAGQVTYHAQI
ncbi:uncharacterized protein [Hetaerina americana]|uniref:uncharacterized protein n=1 Tax=Hetaerina americana TaxID=62018 RepID=UPI003A7F4446